MDNYDYEGEYSNFDSQDFDTLGDTTVWNGEGGPGYAVFKHHNLITTVVMISNKSGTILLDKINIIKTQWVTKYG